MFVVKEKFTDSIGVQNVGLIMMKKKKNQNKKPFLWGVISGIFGMVISSIILLISGFYNIFFFYGASFIFAIVISKRFEKHWNCLWK